MAVNAPPQQFGMRGSAARTKMFQEANSQTIAMWDFVSLYSNQVVASVAVGNAFNSTTASTYPLLGLAGRVGRNTTNPGSTVLGVPGPGWRIADFPVWMFGNAYEVEILLPLGDSSGSTTAPYSGMQPGQKAALYRSAGGVWFVDVNSIGTNPVVQMTEKLPGIYESQNYQAAWFRVLEGVTAFA